MRRKRYSVGPRFAGLGEGGEKLGFNAGLIFRVNAADPAVEGGVAPGDGMAVEGRKGIAPPEFVRVEVEVPDRVVGGAGDALEALVGFPHGGFMPALDGEVADDGRKITRGAVGIFMGDDDLGNRDLAAVAREKGGFACPRAIAHGLVDCFAQNEVGDGGRVKIADG